MGNMTKQKDSVGCSNATGSSADNLAEWVRSGRESMGLPQAELARVLGISVVQISKIENGHAQTTLATLRKMCAAFGKPFVVDW